MRKPKLTTRMVEQAVEMKSHGLSNVDICAGMGITEGTFYRWLREDDTKLKRALKQGLKRAEVRGSLPSSAFASCFSSWPSPTRTRWL